METQQTLHVAEIQLFYSSPIKASLRPKVSSSYEAYQIFIQCWDKGKIELVEQFKVLLLNRHGRVLGIYEASTGGSAGTVVDLKLVFTAALKANAQKIIAAHNHPSGSLTPSAPDTYLTKRFKEAGLLLDLKLEDHLIITTEGYYSFSDNGIL